MARSMSNQYVFRTDQGSRLRHRAYHRANQARIPMPPLFPFPLIPCGRDREGFGCGNNDPSLGVVSVRCQLHCVGNRTRRSVIGYVIFTSYHADVLA